MRDVRKIFVFIICVCAAVSMLELIVLSKHTQFIVVTFTLFLFFSFFDVFGSRIHSSIKVLLLGVIIYHSYALHFFDARTWRSPSSYNYNSMYGPTYTGIDVGERVEKTDSLKRRPKRFVSRDIKNKISLDYATGFFTGAYGLYGYNGLKYSALMHRRKVALKRHIKIKGKLELFLREASQIIVTPTQMSVVNAIKSYNETCLNLEICFIDERQQEMKVKAHWVLFDSDSMVLNIEQLSDEKKNIILNENGFPGWHVAVSKIGSNESIVRNIKLLDNKLGLLAFELEPGSYTVKISYYSHAYAWANRIAVIGFLSWILLMVVICKVYKRLNTKQKKL